MLVPIIVKFILKSSLNLIAVQNQGESPLEGRLLGLLAVHRLCSWNMEGR